MINILKTGNAIVIDFTDNDKYLNNGTIEVAPNELMVVIDESNMATFKKMSNGDTLFGLLIDLIKIQGEAVTKENIIDKFGAIGFSISGGGAVNSVNGQTGDVVITAASLGAITKSEADTAYAAKSDLNSKADNSAVEALSTEVAANKTATAALTSKVNEDSEKIASLDTEMDNKANSADVPTNTQFNNLAGEVANKADKTSVYTKAEADEKFATKQDLNSKADFVTVDNLSADVLNNTNNINYLITQDNEHSLLISNLNTEIGNKQDNLVSGTNIKTVNGLSILGEGNIEIQLSELPIASADTLGGVKVGTGLSINPDGVLSADSPEWNNISGKPEDIINITERLASKLDTATYNSEKSGFATKDELNSKADASAINDMATQTWVQGQGYLTEVPSNYVTDSELTEGLAGKQDIGDYALKSDLNTLATKEELATKADASALSSKLDTLVSGTNIKTINGESILGSGDLTILSGTQPRTWTFTTSSSLTTGDLVTITPSGFTASEWLSQVTTGDMVYLDKGQEFMKLSVSNIYHPTTGNITVGLSFYSTLLYNISVTDSAFSLNINRFPKGKTENYTAIGQDADVTAADSHGVAIGDNAKSNGSNAIAIGSYTRANSSHGVAIGTNTRSYGYLTIAIGADINEEEERSINIGNRLKVSNTNGLSYWDGTLMQSLKNLLAALTPPTVDTAMSDTSENAVQNKVIKKYIDDLVGNILTQLQEINGTN